MGSGHPTDGLSAAPVEWGGAAGGGSGAGDSGRGWKEERQQDQRPEASVLLFRLAALSVRGLRASSTDLR